MRICLYTETALPKMGGQELVVDALARQYLALGHEPTVLAPYPRKLSVADHLLPYRVERHPRFYSTHLFVAWYRRYLLKLHQRLGFDIVHCHGIYPSMYLASLVKNQLGVPVVVTSHGGDVYSENVKLKKKVIETRCIESLQTADALIAISRFTRDGFTRICPESSHRIIDIPNGVNLGDFETNSTPPAGVPPLPSNNYAVFLGRLKFRKGVDVLLHAFARTAVACDATLAIVGDGEELPYLRLLCDQLGISERVRFVGRLSGTAKHHLLQNARFAVVPSRQWEAFPLVVLESFASGLPVIGTDIPGLVDLIQPNKTGLVVPAEDAEQLGNAMTRLFTDDKLTTYLREQAKTAVRAYDWRIVAEKHLALYSRLMSPRLAAAA